MMIRISSKHIFISAAAFVLMLVLIFTSKASAGGSAKQASADVSSGLPVIIIDPGHGGVDGGAVGINGCVEKNVNLEIALLLREKLSKDGFTVMMTRDGDYSIHDVSAKTIRQKKVSDLHNRLAMTRLYPGSILISIHQNSIDSPSVKGAMVFYSKNRDESRQLAEKIQSSLNSSLGYEKNITAAGKNLYLFYNAQNTAVLVECGFLSNEEEEKLLCTKEYQTRLVSCISDGLYTYLGINKVTGKEK